MDDLNAFLRPKDGRFFSTVETVLSEAFSKLRKELGQEIRIVGIVSSPAPPSDENASAYSIDFCTCKDDTAAKENAAGLLASMAERLADSPEEIWETIQSVANRAQEHARSLYESTMEDN